MSKIRNTHTDRFVKGLYASNPTSSTGYEDPTYLGFRLRFDFTPSHRNHSTLFTDDPLFAEAGSDLDSAERYLDAIGMTNKAAAIRHFKKDMESLNKDYPWYIQSVEGLADMWKIPLGEGKGGEAFNNYRMAGKKLTFGCLESIDLRITALANLYRTATFDQYYMRDILPENLKWFTLELDIAEIRTFHRVVNGVGELTVLESEDRQTNKYDEEGHAAVLTDLDNLISIITFRFTKCIFDFDESFPQQDTMSMMYDPVMASSKFSIIPGAMTEKNQYTLLDYVLTSYEATTKIGTTSKYDPVGKPKTDLDAAFNARRPQGYPGSSGMFGGALDKINSLGQEAIGRATDKANEIAGAPQNLLNRAMNIGMAKATAGLLGNVYDKANMTIQQDISNKGVAKSSTTISSGENALSATTKSATTISKDENAEPQRPQHKPKQILGNDLTATPQSSTTISQDENAEPQRPERKPKQILGNAETNG